MQENDENKKNDSIVLVDDNSLIDVKDLSPKQLDQLENIMDQMHHHQYRHIHAVLWKTFGKWIGIYLFIIMFKEYYINNHDFGSSLGETFVKGLVILFYSATVSITAKSITRFYHFKYIAVKIIQAMSIYTVYHLLSIYLLIFNKISIGFETLFNFFEIILVVFLAYFVIFSFIPYKWLKRGTQVFFGLAFTLAISFSFFDGFQHYLFHDNEIIVFSDIEKKSHSKKLSDINFAIDKIIKDLDTK